MLGELQHHDVALQERIRSATEELRMRNEEIVQDYHRILSCDCCAYSKVNEPGARGSQLAAAI